MATVQGLTKSRMLMIEAASVVSGAVNGSYHLILTKFDGSTIDAGDVRGPQGIQGIQGVVGPAGPSVPGSVIEFAGSVLPSGYLWADGASYPTATYPDLFTAIGYNHGGAGASFNVPSRMGKVGVGARPAYSLGAVTVNTTTDIFTTATEHGLVALEKVYIVLTSGTMMGGVTALQEYYVRNVGTPFTFQLSLTPTGALVNATSAGSGVRTLMNPNYILGRVGGEEHHTLLFNEIAKHFHTMTRTSAAGSTFTGTGIPPHNSAVQAGGTADTNSMNEGDTAHQNMPPFIAMNYIIKT